MLLISEEHPHLIALLDAARRRDQTHFGLTWSLALSPERVDKWEEMLDYMSPKLRRLLAVGESVDAAVVARQFDLEDLHAMLCALHRGAERDHGLVLA